MRELNICPSTLQEGFSTYSPTALKQLFDGQPVSHILDFDSPNNESADNEAYVKKKCRQRGVRKECWAHITLWRTAKGKSRC